MDRTETIILAGIIVALIWLTVCVVAQERKRTYVILAGIVADIALLTVCRNVAMLLAGVAGGILCGLFPFRGVRKYKEAVCQMHGVGNWVIVSVIFFTMIFLTVAVAYPDLTIVLE